jgi:arylsulfatase A-like enzyme
VSGTRLPNVLLVSLDTTRADVAYNGAMTTLERLRDRGVTFTQAISSCPLTPVSHASVFTGLQPPGHGVRHLFRERLRPDVPTLAELLADQGYTTGAVVSCPGMNVWYGLNRGFGFYDDSIPRLPDGSDPLEVADVKMRGLALKRAPLVVSRSLEWLDGQRSPFLLFAHFFDAHWPYEPPEDVGVPVKNPYEGEVAYADHYLGRLLDGIADMGHDLDDMLIVCFSDHGEDLGGWYDNDHAGERGHPYEEGHGCLLHDATQHVPLVVCGPGVPVGQEVSAQVRLVDILPTIADMLGCPIPEVDGESLLPLIRDQAGAARAAYSETFFPEERRDAGDYPGLTPLASVRFAAGAGISKVIWQIGGDRVDLYDLADDPNERSATPMAGPRPPHDDRA